MLANLQRGQVEPERLHLPPQVLELSEGCTRCAPRVERSLDLRHILKQLVGRVNEIYRAISSNLSPSKELYTLTAPPVARTEHSRSLTQLALYGVALLALSLPLTIIFCLIHARVREEDATEAYRAAETTAASS